jgi:hypothetical protein
MRSFQAVHMKKYLFLLLLSGSLMVPCRMLAYPAYPMVTPFAAVLLPADAGIVPATEGPSAVSEKRSGKSGFFRRLFNGSGTAKALRGGDELTPANRKAKNSVTLGIIALGSLGLGLLLPYLGIAAIPLGILAIVKGQEAKKEGATRKNGTTLGIISLSLIVFSLLLVSALLGIVAAFG